LAISIDPAQILRHGKAAMKKTLFLLPLLALAACLSPRDACISQARGDLNVLNRLIAETEANIRRGYGLAERQEIITRQDICVIENADGSESRFICDKQEIITVEEPVALDIRAEQAKLASLREQAAAQEERAQATIRACIQAYPDE
jgi:hypothetical protein